MIKNSIIPVSPDARRGVTECSCPSRRDYWSNTTLPGRPTTGICMLPGTYLLLYLIYIIIKLNIFNISRNSAPNPLQSPKSMHLFQLILNWDLWKSQSELSVSLSAVKLGASHPPSPIPLTPVIPIL